MKTYRHDDKPIRIFGLPEFTKTGKLTRLPDEVIEKVPSLTHYGRRCHGARMEFMTDAKELTVELMLKTLGVDRGMSLYHCQSLNVLAGERKNSEYLGLVTPPDYETKQVSKTFKLSGKMQNITIWFPRNEQVEYISVTVPDEAKVEEAPDYTHPVPILYYGSSITEGGCCCNGFNCYNGIISRHLDADFISLGFSGSAKGEPAIAEYINTLDFSVFVYDYDHNAPNIAHLERTHEPFFKMIREAKPDVPVIMMTRPKVRYDDEEKLRREIVRRTYENAVAAGDKNVYFLDGETFYGDEDRELCSMDLIHPNDLGFYRMAMAIEPTVKKILEGLRSE